MSYAHGLHDSVVIPRGESIFYLLFFLSFPSENFHWFQREILMHLQFVQFLADREKGERRSFAVWFPHHFCFAIYSIVSLCYSLQLF